MPILRRTHTCGELRESHVGQTVDPQRLGQHLPRPIRDQVFVDLRDRYGLTQVVFEADDQELFAAAQELRSEFVPRGQGHGPRPAAGQAQPEAGDRRRSRSRPTELHVLNRCPTPPFEVTEFPDEELANEDLRLQYRYLDLRRPSLQRTLALRHRLNKVIRDYLDAQGFLELETPLLGRSTPEGARDYLVPSRVHPGQLVRPAAVAAALQAAADGGRLRQVFPDRPLPARRGPAGRPPAGVHAARPGNVVRRAWTTSSRVIEGLIGGGLPAVPRRRRSRCRCRG